ncbi:hypothetical protein GJW-30_1_03550 [Variibacter gotjawalensis]|uniref:DUF4239 domain-containing protein n=1 Tax=Variibacter gotjawalensis TaxID=1333996 RepID=A0A0S3PYH3_9BRAD|nr:DUF4239 domain-containing protein [Variibacter gotjawalensis]NIK46837.1 hypothetical protein [Variibacter gotjawalensis]RZS48741.1 uncharacterized protein DUF4239 [Variibacter gotjawalensis]BAT61000.1 hypothetical protein GJW-30_1_03550 [Variibacter gotjawalensis]
MFVGFHQLPLWLMFFVILAMSMTVCWVILCVVRWSIPRLGYAIDEPLPIRDSVIGACGGMFALIVAFSAAGIWNDAVSARNAVQREADAIENAMILTLGLPAEAQQRTNDYLRTYVKQVLDIDWPAMRKSEPLDAPIFDESEKSLLSAIELLSRQHDTLRAVSTYEPLLQQVLAIRQARLSRLAASNAGVTWAQWFAMWIISTTTLFFVAICNSHSFRTQIIATHFYALAILAAYFVILSHDRPFVGQISVQPTALSSLLK